MQKKHLKELITSLNIISITGKDNPLVSSVSYDSRTVENGGLFFAIKGIHVDGHRYISQAETAGAVAIIHSEPIKYAKKGISYIQVPDTRIAMSPVSAKFHDHPSKELTVVGVTGTDGKSTTVSFIRQILEFAKKKAGSLSTVEFSIGNKNIANPLRQSTPEAPQIHQFLRMMCDAGEQYAVLEATSHGLSPRNSRLEDVLFDVAVFTNVTSEHLDFHGNLDTYRRDKSRLFQMIAKSQNQNAFAVINAQDPHAEIFICASGDKAVFTYSVQDTGNTQDMSVDLLASNIHADPSGTTFNVSTPQGTRETRLNLPGVFNVENFLAALCTVSELCHIDPLELTTVCPNIRGIKGRMESILSNAEFHVIVDYAHSPGSYKKLLPFLRTLTTERLIIVFGSAGERDKKKRAEQGKIASQYGDIIILTNEDPRGEDPMKIVQDIAMGIDGFGENLHLIPNRREAIQTAFHMARQKDIVVTLGKGHEKSIIMADGSENWDEAEICRELLREMGFEA